jgi:hypothetical protein
MRLDQTFNTNDLPQSAGFDPIEAGWYTATITGAEVKQTKNGDGQYISVQYTITGPKNQGRIVYANVNIRNSSVKAQEIGLANLNAIMRSVGIAVLQDTDQLIGGNLKIKVKISPAKDGYEASNDVNGWEALEGSQPPAPPKAEEKGKPAFLR